MAFSRSETEDRRQKPQPRGTPWKLAKARRSVWTSPLSAEGHLPSPWPPPHPTLPHPTATQHPWGRHQWCGHDWLKETDS